MFSNVKPATDGSLIPRRVVEEYINSDSYKDAIDKHLMLGSVTHSNRVLPSDKKNVIGKDDMILLDNSAVCCVERIFVENDGWTYCVIRFFDEELMDDASKQRIRQMKGLIRNGVKISGSAVIVAYWSSEELCEKIVKVSGYDFTLNSAFHDSGIVEVLEDENIGKKEGGLSW